MAGRIRRGLQAIRRFDLERYAGWTKVPPGMINALFVRVVVCAVDRGMLNDAIALHMRPHRQLA